MRRRWQIWIDRGGTFTDCLALAPDHRHFRVAKVLSGALAPVAGIRALLGLDADTQIPACDIRLGTTLATNALLERQGAAMALVITQGFGDLLTIGDQTRRELFALAIEKPNPLAREVLEIDARVSAGGEVLATPDFEALGQKFEALRRRGVESLAVVLMHAYTPGGGELERAVGACAVAAGFDPSLVCLSHRVSGVQGMLARGETTAADAYLTPVLQRYLGRLQQHLPGSTLRLMTSSGALVAPKHFRGHRAVVSGPAGGVTACQVLANQLNLGQVIGFDMGGTSTDVSRVTGEGPIARTYQGYIGGVRVRAPMMDIHTVAAGGGSLCRYDGHRLTVGPASAGAQPGPICYGDSGARELALTDISVALGRIAADRFPFTLDRVRVDAALAALAEQVGRGPQDVASGFFAVAVASMAAAIAKVSTARGYDVRDHAMIVFGGAGGQYACAVAEELGMTRLVFHPLAGVFSAFGMGMAAVGWDGEIDAGREPLTASLLVDLWAKGQQLLARGRAHLDRDGPDAHEDFPRLRERLSLDLRYRGTQAPLCVSWAADDSLEVIVQRFDAAHRRLFGYRRPDHPIEVVNVRAELLGATNAGSDSPSRLQIVGKGETQVPTPNVPVRVTRMYAGGRFHDDVPVWWRESLADGARLKGPALILEATSTLVLDPGWQLSVGPGGSLVAQFDGVKAARGTLRKVVDTPRLQGPNPIASEGSGGNLVAPLEGAKAARGRIEEVAHTPSSQAVPDPVLLEILGNRIMTIAEQMGVVLQRTALSTNIRERLDFSCAVFDRRGELVANAPHIPVHLGAMGASVRGVLRAHPN
ncbi:MAG: hydantoinase/oxoprolinase family protein, partial [Nannocystaceae bacterium]